MQPNQQLCFLKDKIQEIGSAIFFNLSESVLKLPTSIVETTKVDEFGFVWFYIQKPKQHLREFDKEFPVRMEFFKKGINFFLQVEGRAWMINDPEEMNTIRTFFNEEKLKGTENMVLVKVKMIKAEYHETGNRMGGHSWWQNAVSNIYTWFRSGTGAYRPGIFYPASLN